MSDLQSPDVLQLWVDLVSGMLIAPEVARLLKVKTLIEVDGLGSADRYRSPSPTHGGSRCVNIDYHPHFQEWLETHRPEMVEQYNAAMVVRATVPDALPGFRPLMRFGVTSGEEDKEVDPGRDLAGLLRAIGTRSQKP